MTRKAAWRAVPVIALVLVMLTSVPAYATPSALRMPGPWFSTSRNWSGYAAQTSLADPQDQVVSDVKATWTVTAVSETPVTAYSATWIGIDGYSSNTVEQIGTDANWVNGQAVYSAWYEMYPKWPKTIKTIPVHPGDVISTEVRMMGKGGFTLSMTNVTTGKSFSVSQKAPSAKRSSAEWIVEAPWSGGTLPLAHFAPISFTDCQTTISGHPGPISDSLWENDPLTMVGPTGTDLAVPSSLTSGGSAFTMTWLAYN